MSGRFLVNGKPSDSFPINDRGLHYGDGVFETIAVRDGGFEYLNLHLERLKRSCQRLGIFCPQYPLLKNEMVQLCATTRDAVLKIIVTRGLSNRGYRADPARPVSRMLSLYDWPNYPESFHKQGVKTTLCNARLARNPQLAGIKHLNRLENVLARSEWDDQYQEGLMLDTCGDVIEGTMSNIFVIQDQTLLTPTLDFAGITGIMRGLILATAAKIGIPVEIQPLRLNDIRYADGLFICNSIIGLWPVVQFEQFTYQKHPLIDTLVDSLKLRR